MCWTHLATLGENVFVLRFFEEQPSLFFMFPQEWEGYTPNWQFCERGRETRVLKIILE